MYVRRRPSLSGSALPVLDLADAVVADQGRGQLRRHAETEGTF
jgi:hypothetical protein